jgi:thiol:disulfide interchange protein DsbD
MKKILSALLFIFICNVVMAQIENPVTWTFSAKKIAAKKYELHMTAAIQGNWHLYSQNAGEGPEPTNFVFTKNPLVKVEGKVVEVGKMESMYDPNFKSTLKFYNGTVDFVQKINLKSSASTVVKGSVTFMVCNDRRCLPPKEIPFTIKVDGK